MSGGGGTTALPLAGITVIDASRMLPGAILARTLIDLGVRLVKVEDPVFGDPLRHLPPFAGGVGASFAVLLGGAESVTLDLRSSSGAGALGRMTRHADVLVESFRPGTLARWGLAPERLLDVAPALIVCSLSGFGAAAADAVPAHDLNFAGLTGALSMLGDGVPGVQLADVGAALLASTAVLAGLFRRQRTGRGGHLDQPLITGPFPFLVWAWAEAAAGGGGMAETVMRGEAPCYHRYTCSDGLDVAVAALEPKFWAALVARLELPDLAGLAFATGGEGVEPVAKLGAVFAAHPRGHWLELAAREGLPITAVHSLADLAASAPEHLAPWLNEAPLPDGGCLRVPGPFVPSLGAAPARPAPTLGQHTAAVLAELAAD
jgi:alpha-methylacyl-CoA racemase